MTTEPASSKDKATAATSSMFALLGNTEWVKALNDAPTKIYASGWEKALSLAADRLQDQAAYLKQLSQCTDPAEALKLNTAFSQQLVTRMWEDGVKLFDGIRTSIASATPGK